MWRFLKSSEPVDVRPYDDERPRKEQVRRMFDRIAPRYDLLNRLLSFRTDVYWRRQMVRRLRPYAPRRILDVATGTGDVPLALLQLAPREIVAVDLAPRMIQLAREKISRIAPEAPITLQVADAERLPFEEAAFDAVTVAFGVRNFEDLDRGLQEMMRVLREKGVLAVLEFSRPGNHPLGWVYRWYSRYVLPRVGGWISGDASAYRYLPASIAAFPSGKEFEARLVRAGARKTFAYPLTGGIATLYLAEK